jgi:hypothetical protein
MARKKMFFLPSSHVQCCHRTESQFNDLDLKKYIEKTFYHIKTKCIGDYLWRVECKRKRLKLNIESEFRFWKITKINWVTKRIAIRDWNFFFILFHRALFSRIFIVDCVIGISSSFFGTTAWTTFFGMSFDFNFRGEEIFWVFLKIVLNNF